MQSGEELLRNKPEMAEPTRLEISELDDRAEKLVKMEGDSLQAANLLLKKNKMLKGETGNHDSVIRRGCQDGQHLIDTGHPDHEQSQQDLNDLLEKMQHLKEMLEVRRQKLLVPEKARQFFFYANEAETWACEQELYVMVEDRGKDKFSAPDLVKKRDALEDTADDFSSDEAPARQAGPPAHRQRPPRERAYRPAPRSGQQALRRAARPRGRAPRQAGRCAQAAHAEPRGGRP